MDHSPAQIIVQYLVDEGLATEPDSSGEWPVYTGHLPDGTGVVDNVLAVYDTPGTKDGRPLDGLPLFHDGIQVRVRSTDYSTGWIKARAVADALGEISEEVVAVDGTDYIIHNISQSTAVVPLGQEEGTKRRDHFTVNFLATLKEDE